ncbi:MAG: DUF480 domain-containing protein, partial [Planctomyces sp.]
MQCTAGTFPVAGVRAGVPLCRWVRGCQTVHSGFAGGGMEQGRAVGGGDWQMTDGEKNTIRQLTRLQRRVLGTLVEKAFTTPDQYPMTVKGLMTGC